MTQLLWIVLFGLLMCLLALVGGLTLFLPERVLKGLIKPFVALAAGSLLGGALFHMIPEALHAIPDPYVVFLWVAAGFVSFFMLEQFLHWHHCHRAPSEHHQPLTWLLLVADGVHNFLGGLAVGGAFMVDVRVGIVTWLVAAAHEVPQELGDFGVLIHGGWKPRKALLFNVLSASTFLVGGIIAWAVSSSVDVSFLVPLGAGNFLYIAAADLIPEVKHEKDLRKAGIHFGFFAAGLGVLLLIHQLGGGHHHHGGDGHDHAWQDHAVEEPAHDHAEHSHSEHEHAH